jgi:DNA repair photolyase
MENLSTHSTLNPNLLHLPINGTPQENKLIIDEIPTPKSDEIFKQVEVLEKISKYKSVFNYDVYKKLEQRFGLEQPRGGVIFKTPFKLVNSHHTCQQCLYSFEIDTYGRGCVHDCVYCYAKAELTVHGYWNAPFPMPVDVSDIWKTFYTVFETDKKTKWRDVMEKRIPLRIGSMSDSFMFMDQKYGVTKELLRILDFYDYPYVIFTRSDLVANDEYLKLLNPDLCSIQMSISSTNDEMNKLIEAGAPSSKRRLKALQKLTQNGFWTTVRLNPFFPIYADGYFSDPNFDKTNMATPFHYSSFEMVDEIAQYGVQSVLAGMVRLSKFSLNQMEKALGRDLQALYKAETRKDAIFSETTKKKSRDFHFSELETRAYYERIQAKCLQNGIQFTTCYIGNGEQQFWRDQDLWSNKKDCCNVQGRVSSFQTDSRSIDWATRMKHTSHKVLKPNDPSNLHTALGPAIIVRDGIAMINENFLHV